MKFGIQMYLFRNKCFFKNQTLKTLNRVANMGFDGIELFKSNNIPARDIKEAVGNCDILNPMLWYSSFEPNKIDVTIKWLKDLGAKEAAYNCIPVASLNTEIYEKYNLKYQDIAKKMAKNDLIFCHHNHKDEYMIKDGNEGIDILLNNVNPYCLEIDTYWVKEIGRDVLALMEERKDHLRYIHIKDKKNGAKKFCPIGQGDMDNRPIIDKAIELGLDYVIIDLDNSDCDVFEAASQSLKWLKDNYS